MKFTTKRGEIWYLHRKKVAIGHGQVFRTNFYFKKSPDQYRIYEMPDGYEVMETKTGMPVLKRMSV